MSHADALWRIVIQSPEGGAEVTFVAPEDRAQRILRGLARDQGVVTLIGRSPESLWQYLTSSGQTHPGGSRTGTAQAAPARLAESEMTSLLAEIEAAFARTDYRSDVERLAVISFFIVKAGGDGLDAASAATIYDQLGLRVPARWGAAFSNAKRAGYLESHTRGLWKPAPAARVLALEGKRPRKQRGGTQV